MNHVLHDHFQPKLIVWQLVSSQDGHNGHPHSDLTTHECLLTIDGIARTGKPIVVLNGPNILQRPDLIAIVQYAVALGLKMIVEVRPAEITDAALRTFSSFGHRIFRVLVDDCIVEDIDTRYKETESYALLEQVVRKLRDAGFEIHLGATISRPDVRQLAFDHDYAITHRATGFYCHFSFERTENAPDPESIESLVSAVAMMKSYSPRDMYFSPQCIRYGHRLETFVGDTRRDEEKPSGWDHWCLGGKTFVYINAEGAVQLCAGLGSACGNLRSENFNFKKIWESSQLMKHVRENEWTCLQTRDQFLPHVEREQSREESKHHEET
jgi:MoaA/NifB/PqqE/SkfB family radical SAM enzyme